MENQDIRWKQRFQNFSRAFLLLRQAVERDFTQFDDLQKEGTIQRFEYTFELAWKTLKDIMEYDGHIFERISPNFIIKDAFQNKYIDDADVWLKMAQDRNLLSHTYNFDTFENVLLNIKEMYYPAFDDFYMSLIDRQI